MGDETRTLVSVEEYLSTSYEDGDREYLDGEVVERNVGELPHSLAMAALSCLFVENAKPWGVMAATAIRVQITPRRYFVADVAVWRKGNIGTGIPTVPPFLAIEILSPKDRVTRMLPKVREYLASGTEFVWVIDPVDERAMVFSAEEPGGVLAEVLTTRNPDVAIALRDVLRPEE